MAFRKFPRHLFCGGGQLGPELLLKRLRGEEIAWEQVVEKLRGHPQKCGKDIPQVVRATRGLCPTTAFTVPELLRGPKRQRAACTNCIQRSTCEVVIPQKASHCLWCAGYSTCRSCGNEFLPPAKPRNTSCAACHKKHGTLWVCGRCTLAKPLHQFSHQREWYAASTLTTTKRRRCDACVEEEKERDHASHTVPTPETTQTQPDPQTKQQPTDLELRCYSCGPRTASHFSISQLLLGEERHRGQCLGIAKRKVFGN